MHHADAMNDRYDLICFSHLRWEFVFQRPQHLLSRAARDRRVFFFEEPIRDDGPARLQIRESAEGVTVVQPHLPHTTPPADERARLRSLVDEMVDRFDLERYVVWFYTPMALPFAAHLEPLAVVFDCMDELSAFKGAPPELLELERQLIAAADVMFTGGKSLYHAKKDRHPNVHAFPSAVDVAHFAKARTVKEDPADQAAIPHPRVGFFGVIDERLDIDLLRASAELRPDLQFVMVGPVVKIDPESLPKLPNIHYLGGKHYKELPQYISGWDVAVMPFARNESTKFISPTKTPEYLAAGRPVVSTSITDVIDPYLDLGLVRIADTANAFTRAIDAALAEDGELRQKRADRWLAQISWDRTWEDMDGLIELAIEARAGADADALADTGEHPALNLPAAAPGGELAVGAA